VEPKNPKEIIDKLKACTWRYNNIKHLDDKIHYGFIAQDILEAFGDEYNFVDDSEEFYKVNYLEFIAPIIHVVQEQERNIKYLEYKIKKIEEILNANGSNGL
jgi:hypothetical protein